MIFSFAIGISYKYRQDHNVTESSSISENKIYVENNNTKDTFKNNPKVSIGDKVEEVQNNNEDISTAVAQARVLDNDASNIWWLACTIYHEGRGLSDEAQIAIASVVLNRVNSEKFPNNIFEVLVQDNPKQYSFVRNEIIDGSPDERAIKNAEFVYKNGSQIPENVLYQSIGIQGSGVWKVIDEEYFCYE